jgi:hypothetical protein
MKNEGFSPEAIAEIKDEMKRTRKNFVLDIPEGEDRDAESAYFYFVGKHEGKEVIYDAFMYTLRMEYEMALFEAAEAKMLKKYPKFKEKGMENATEDELDYMDLLMAEIEEEGIIKVSEFAKVDTDAEFGVGLDVCLNVDEITDAVITKFVDDFNNNRLKLDKTLYDFPAED